VRDGAGNDAVIALPAQTIADGSAIVIDTLRQYQQHHLQYAQRVVQRGDGIDVTVTFSESVSLDGAGVLEITLDTGDVVSIAGPQGPGAVFSGTYTVGRVTRPGILTLRDSAFRGHGEGWGGQRRVIATACDDDRRRVSDRGGRDCTDHSEHNVVDCKRNIRDRD